MTTAPPPRRAGAANALAGCRAERQLPCGSGYGHAIRDARSAAKGGRAPRREHQPAVGDARLRTNNPNTTTFTTENNRRNASAFFRALISEQLTARGSGRQIPHIHTQSSDSPPHVDHSEGGNGGGCEFGTGGHRASTRVRGLANGRTETQADDTADDSATDACAVDASAAVTCVVVASFNRTRT